MCCGSQGLKVAGPAVFILNEVFLLALLTLLLQATVRTSSLPSCSRFLYLKWFTVTVFHGIHLQPHSFSASCAGNYI
jgi:hypothetical protein